jgi:UDP-sulfoquinovose synthase
MNVLLTGIDGYIGWPAALKLAKEFPDARIIGIDNLARRKWVEECGAISAIPVQTMEARIKTAKQKGFTNISFIQGDLIDRDFVNEIIMLFKPEIIIHLAAQPSAPYSHINGEKANYTQYNNNQATRNLLWGIKEANLASKCNFIETTTMGVYGAPEFEIPEGFLEVEMSTGKDIIPYPGMAGSWYHMSKSNDVNNLYLANKLWGLPIIDLRMAIVYGTETEETAIDPGLATRFDFDFYFGVVGNRFCAMALTGHPITIYGKGEQRKPQISLEDCVCSIVNAVKLQVNNGKQVNGKFEVYNQTTEAPSIKGIAEAVKKAGEQLKFHVEINHIPNPRVEKEDHKMVINTDKFKKLLVSPKYNIDSGIYQTLNSLLPHKDVIAQYKDRFLAA